MDLMTRLAELAIMVVCVGVMVRRYSGKAVKVVPADVLLWTLVLFFVAPLAIDIAGVQVNYAIFPAMTVGNADPLVRFLAAAGTLFAVSVAAYLARRGERVERRTPQREFTPRHRRLWLAASFLPVAVVLLAPAPGVYRTFAAPFVLRGVGQAFADPKSPVAHWNVFVSWSTYVSCVAFAVWFVTGRRTMRSWLLAGTVGYMDLWFNGKRHIVAMFAMLVVFSLASRVELSRRQVRRAAALGAVALIGVIATSAWYEATYRPFVAAHGEQAETFIIDFGRLDVLRLALAGQTGLDVPRPLDYPGQSFALDVTVATRRDPTAVTYADRVTSIGYQQPIGQQSGAITTSLISEAVDNFGVAGLIVGPLLLGLLAAAASYRNDPLLRVVGAMLAATLAVVHVLAVIPIVVLLVVRFGWLWLRRPAPAPVVVRAQRVTGIPARSR